MHARARFRQLQLFICSHSSRALIRPRRPVEDVFEREVRIAIADCLPYEQGKVKLHQSVDLSADGTFSLGFLGSLTGLILVNAAASATCGALTDVGIDARFMKELAATLSPGSSVLFVLTGRPTPHRDKLQQELKGTGGKILQTTLSHEDQSSLQAALGAAREGS
jgi:uncharacterized membrane protein